MVVRASRFAVRCLVVTTAVVFASAFGLAGPAAATTSPSTLVVGSGAGDYASIGAAVADASAGDTIQVSAGTYTEDVTVPVAVTLVGAGAASTTIVGTLTLDAPTDVSDFTLMGQAAVPATGGADPVWMNAGSAGSDIHDNVISDGNDAVYASGIPGTPNSVTLIEHNTITDFHGPPLGQGNGVWIWQSDYFDVVGNTIDDGTPIDDGSAGVNLGCGSSHVSIASNAFANLDNATVDIASDTCPASSDVTIADNTVDNTDSSPLYFGGNNITNVTIAGNGIQLAGGTGGGIVISGYDGWLADPGVPISGFAITANSISDAPNGLYLGADAQLAGNSAVTSSGNTYCSSGLAIDNETTAGYAIASSGDNFCSSGTTGVLVAPASTGSTPASSGSGSKRVRSVTVAVASQFGVVGATSTTSPIGSLAVTGDGKAGSSSRTESSSPPTSRAVKTAVQTTKSAFPFWLVILMALVVLCMLFFLVFVVARRRGDA